MTTTTTTALDLDAIKADPGARDVPALIAEVERLRAKLEQPCGSCHPCTNYRDETWRAADRKPPHVHEWDELRAEADRLGEENARLRAELGRPLTGNERAFQDGV
jgi:hypothetical protein